MFGKKKKDEKADTWASDAISSVASTMPSAQTAPPQTPSTPPPTMMPIPQKQPATMPGQYQPPRAWSNPSQADDEDSSLSKLLQSLLKDLPPDEVAVGAELPNPFSTTSTPEWVPPRSTPTSRPMVIPPTGKKPPDQDRTIPQSSQPAYTPPPPPAPPVRSPTPPQPTVEKPTVVSKPAPQPQADKQDKPAKQEASKRPSTSKVSQSFDHIFELTQGSFDNPGLVVVNGSIGSGKTTLCSGLASSFLKQGNPCMYVTYDKAPSALRDQMKKLSFDPSESESNYRLLVVDGFSSQSDSFSFEPYYVEKAFDFDSIQDALVKNSSMFIGEKPKIIFDSMDQVVAKVDSKDFVKQLGETLDKLRDSSVTFIATIDLSKAPKDVVKWLEDTAACVIDLDKYDSDPNVRELNVRKLNGSNSKIDAETFEIDSGKGLVFVN